MASEPLGIVKGEIESQLQAILENKQELAKLREFADAFDWYGKTLEASKQPGKVEAMVINKVIEELLKIMPLQFLTVTFDKAIFDGRGKGETEFVIRGKLPPLRPNVYFTPVVDGIRISNRVLKMSFEVDSDVDGVAEIHSDESGKRVDIKEVTCTMTLYLLAKMWISSKPVKISEAKVFLVKGFPIYENVVHPMERRA